MSRIQHATDALRAQVDKLLADGAATGDVLNALAAVMGDLVREVAQPGHEPRLARDVVARINARAGRW